MLTRKEISKKRSSNKLEQATFKDNGLKVNKNPKATTQIINRNDNWFEAERISDVIPKTKLDSGLYVTATPIGNLSDLTIRAIHILKSVDGICCEDTRVTSRLLNKYGIQNKLYSYHDHSTEVKVTSLITILKEGQSLALVSDAGVPTISDPGSKLISVAHSHCIPIYSIPGPSAVISSLSISGLSGTKFIFDGFLHRNKSERVKQLKLLYDMSSSHTIVFYETKHRILDSLKDCMNIWSDGHHCVVIRELTKIHEQVIKGPLLEVHNRVKENNIGEFTVLIKAKRETLLE